MAKETIVVEALGKWGPKVNGTYYSFSPKCKEADKGKLVPGGTFDVEVFTAESGKKYINAVGEMAQKQLTGSDIVKLVQKPVFTSEKKVYTKKSDEMSKEEWAAKDVRISRQGLIQACIQAVAPLVALENVFTEAEKLANQALEYVNRK